MAVTISAGAMPVEPAHLVRVFLYSSVSNDGDAALAWTKIAESLALQCLSKARGFYNLGKARCRLNCNWKSICQHAMTSNRSRKQRI